MYKVLGTGGYGCVISPAIVFQNSKEVTEENKQQFVTKIAGDAEEEYDIAMYIVSLLKNRKSIGIFPVDSLECGISKASLGPYYEQVVQRCSNVKAIRRKTESGLFRQGKFFGGSKELCAIQYPRYQEDLTFFYRRDNIPYFLVNLPVRFVVKRVINLLLINYTVLHSIRVYHLDTKAENLCFMKLTENSYTSIEDIDVRIADWGFALVASPDSMEDIRQNMQMLVNSSQYFFDVLADVNITISNTSSRRINNALFAMIVKFNAATPTQQIRMYELALRIFEVFDNLCIARVCMLMIENYHRETAYNHPERDNVEKFVRLAYQKMLLEDEKLESMNKLVKALNSPRPLKIALPPRISPTAPSPKRKTPSAPSISPKRTPLSISPKRTPLSASPKRTPLSASPKRTPQRIITTTPRSVSPIRLVSSHLTPGIITYISYDGFELYLFNKASLKQVTVGIETLNRQLLDKYFKIVRINQTSNSIDLQIKVVLRISGKTDIYAISFILQDLVTEWKKVIPCCPLDPIISYMKIKMITKEEYNNFRK
jgi:hypothetical protein